MQQYTFNPEASTELTRAIREGCVPRLRQTPGFVAYYWLDTNAGSGASLCVFEDRGSAEAAIEMSSGLVDERLKALAGPHQVIKGAVMVYANSGLEHAYVFQTPSPRGLKILQGLCPSSEDHWALG
jgi:hypothetical protein